MAAPIRQIRTWRIVVVLVGVVTRASEGATWSQLTYISNTAITGELISFTENFPKQTMYMWVREEFHIRSSLDSPCTNPMRLVWEILSVSFENACIFSVLRLTSMTCNCFLGADKSLQSQMSELCVWISFREYIYKWTRTVYRLLCNLGSIHIFVSKVWTWHFSLHIQLCWC